MMRFFLPCFRDSKRRQKHLRSVNAANPTRRGQTQVAEGALEASAIQQPTQQKTFVNDERIHRIAESKIENEEQSYDRAEVTSTKEVVVIKHIEGTKEEEQVKAASEEKFTPQSQTLILIGESGKKDNNNEEEECSLSESLFSLPIGFEKPLSGGAETEEVNSPMQPPKEEAKVENQNSTKLVEEQPSCVATTTRSRNDEESLANKLEENKEEKGKARAMNQNHPVVHEYRYREYCSEEEEYEEDTNQGESSESLFSLCTDSRKRISSAEKAENEVSSSLILMPAQVTQEEDDSQGGRVEDVCSVLNPIENLTQGKVVKLATVQQPLKKDKENINSVVMQNVDIVDHIPISTPEPSLKLSNRKVRQKVDNDIGVETSLSSWLVESETTPPSSVGDGGRRGSPYSHEDRPILGALTIEEIRKYSASASSRRSRSRSPEETPIIGTVGSYWSHTRQTKTKSKSMSSKFNNSGKGSSTTVKTRLEAAFEASVADI